MSTVRSEIHAGVPSTLRRMRAIALGVGLAGAALSVLGLVLDRQQFFRSYLFGYLYWWTFTVGCLGVAVLYQMTGGRWGYASRPFFDSGIRTLPLITLAFLPLALGLEWIYPWSAQDFFANDPLAAHRQWYLSVPFFLWRAVGYFAICWLFGLIFTTRVVRSDGTMRTQTWPIGGGIGGALLVLVVSFAVIDWGMSLDPEWYSTIYGGVFVISGLLTGLCVVSAGAALAVARLDRRDEVSITILHDLGKLILALVMMWAYFQFSQYLIVYAGDMPVESIWYVQRMRGGWQWVGGALMILHFALPFCALLSANLKRNPKTLAALAVAVLLVHLLDVYWIIIPSLRPGRVTLHWLDATIIAGLGGLWLFVFFGQLQRRLVPVLNHWPYLEAAELEPAATSA